MKIIPALGLIAALVLTGCASPAQVRAQAIQQAKDHCMSEGKQFVLGNVEQSNRGMDTVVTVSGGCVGPGDPGYITPPTH